MSTVPATLLTQMSDLPMDLQQRLERECSPREIEIIVGKFSLYDYQIRAVLDIRQLMRQGKKSILLVSPVGSGKTRMAACIVFMAQERALERAQAGGELTRSAFVVDRLPLVKQTFDEFVQSGIQFGVLQADHPLFKPSRQAQICSVQTMQTRQWPLNLMLAIIDEAHSLYTPATKLIEKRQVVAIGLTATPFAKGLGKLYESVVNVAKTRDLIDRGFLVDYDTYVPSEIDMKGVRVSAGEWNKKETSERAMQVVGDCVSEYLKLGEGRKFICSAVDIAHAQELQRQFLAAGVHCALYTSKTPDVECDEIQAEFKKPDSYIRGLVTVSKAAKGFNVTDVGVIIMARPLRNSLAEHIQLLGRGIRQHPGKGRCIVLDHTGNSIWFQKDVDDFFANGAIALDDGKRKPAAKRGDVPEEDRLAKCPSCKLLHKPAPACPKCGHEYPKRDSTVKHKAGTLTEMIASGDVRELTAELWPQIVQHAINRKGMGSDAERMAKAIYKDITKQWPQRNFYTTTPAPILPEVGAKIRAMTQAYIIRRQKTEKKAAQHVPLHEQSGEPAWV